MAMTDFLRMISDAPFEKTRYPPVSFISITVDIDLRIELNVYTFTIPCGGKLGENRCLVIP